MAAIQANDNKKALSLGLRMIKLPTTGVQDCMAVAEMGERMVDNHTAMLAVRAAVKRAPGDLHLLFELVRTEFAAGYTKDALAHLNVAQGLCRTAEDFDTLGNYYKRLEQATLSHEAFSKAHELAPEHVHILSNLGISFSFLGRDDEAEEMFNRAIALGDKNPSTYLNRSWLRTQTEENNHIAELEAVVADLGEEAADAPMLFNGLAKEYEDLGRDKEAFDTLEKANAARRAQIEFSIDQDAADTNDIITTYDAEFMARKSGSCSSDEPIFILGLHRSGSTLVERILGNHSKVFAAGELSNFKNMVKLKTAEAARAEGQGQVVSLETIQKIDMRSLGKSYLDSTRPRTGHVPHFIDKFPSNYIFCGLIVKCLPNAKMIHTKRNAMDVCYAILKQAFMQGYYFSYDQAELGAAYLNYLKVMDHWEEMMPGRIIHVAYEDMVADNEKVSRDLVQRLGLEWEDACLDFISNTEASMTASANQVRQPIYSTSVDKWRRFEDRLTLLRKTLEAGGVDVG